MFGKRVGMITKVFGKNLKMKYIMTERLHV